jgi:hypothetical protein
VVVTSYDNEDNTSNEVDVLNLHALANNLVSYSLLVSTSKLPSQITKTKTVI